MGLTTAIIGNGAMGFAIGKRFLEEGVAVRAYDRNPPKVQALADLGAVGCGSPAEAAAGAGYVVTSLNSAEAVEAVIFGDGGAAERAAEGTLIVDMSSIDPEATTALAGRAAERGLRWVDSPLSGGAPKAALGTLTLMAGGAEEDVADAHELLKHVSANYTRMGGPGAGQATKLINQVLCGLGFVAVAEATKLAEDAGVDAALIPTALKGGRADSAILQEYMPRFAGRDYEKTGRIDNMVKDLNAVQDLARGTGTAMPLTALAAEIHRLMTAAGWGGEDQATLMEYWRGR
ncbi:MAG: NAD(P)-dependent oxidoreductase [Pseudomonadota bacterium]